MASNFTFKGGVHPLQRIHHGKPLTQTRAIEACSVPGEVVLPLSQHIGAPSVPAVAVGDRVDMGQKIAEASGNVSVPCYSSVSGTVKAIEPRPDIAGRTSMAIVIANDFEDRLFPGIQSRGSLESLTPKELLEIIKDAGIVGMGGAAFPTHIKLCPPPGKKIDTVIVNGAECEPYLTADHRVMLEHPEGVVFGLKVIMKILDVTKACVAIEANKPDATEAIREAAKKENIGVVTLKVKYPQGAEKQLIHAVTGRQVPSGGLPMEVGAVVVNAGTAYQISLAVQKGMPLIERVVTVTGSVARPSNLLVRLGTPISHVIAEAGGFSAEIGKVIAGGPMMGITQYDMSVPVVKGTSGLLALDVRTARPAQDSPCIRCGKCVAGCPMGLEPWLISAYADAGRMDDAEKNRALDCIECGCCSYICPANRHLVQSIRLAKAEILKARCKCS
jgi:electron transport complex protein RnfC